MSEMVERVARAICVANKEDPDKEYPYVSPESGVLASYGVYQPQWVQILPLARAAINALREPTQEIIDAAEPAMRKVNHIVAHAGGVQWDNDEPPLAPAWRAMIDACLK